MSEIAKLIDDIIRLDLAKRLKADGYRKSGRTFHFTSDLRTVVVNVQGSKSNLGDDGKFTINLGIYFPDVAKITGAIPFTGSFPKEYNCTIRQRLGKLMTDGNDFWWSVSSDSDLDAIARNVGDAWAQHGKPWIDHISDLDAVNTELLKQKLFFIAAGVSLLRGRRDEATELIRQAESRQPRAAAKIQAWARQHELA